MAAMVASWRLAVRKACGQAHSNVLSRGLRTSSRQLAAQNFTMPAMSPTMTEGNISSWKVKEGDSFSTGDVLLEIETDKAQMDVEAQDEGVMAKITKQDGSKSVKVGTRIGVLAEPGDDLSALEIPPEESAPTPSAKSEDKPSEPQPESASSSPASPSPPAQSSSQTPPGTPSKQKYPLYPSVQHLLHSNGLPLSEADKIPASGPQGRLLKGDVLSYLGSISPTYASELSSRVEKRGHLDLSNVKLAQPKEPAPAAADAARAPSPKPADLPPPPPPPPADVTLPISLGPVLSLQTRLEETLDIHLPLATFISRAATVANANLPASKAVRAPSVDELFDEVLGANLASTHRLSTRGHFSPEIATLSGTPKPSTGVPPRVKAPPRQTDVYDILTGRTAAASPKRLVGKPRGTEGPADPTTNLFRVTAERGDEKRAMVFLERIKAVLEGEPGRLVM